MYKQRLGQGQPAMPATVHAQVFTQIRKMKNILIMTVLLLIAFQLSAQEIHKTVLSDKDPQGLYLNDGESELLFYHDLTPASPNGTVLVLLSGFFRDAKEVFQRTTLPKEASAHHIVTLVPSINSRIHADTACFHFINTMIRDYSERTGLEVRHIIIGGISAGGIVSLTYTIWMNQHPQEHLPAPKATFTVDSPVDLANFWQVEKRLVERNCSEAAVAEANYVLQYLTKYLGGAPETVPEAYQKASVFSRGDGKGGQAVYLREMPVRAYCEPDIHYHLKKCEDYLDMNASDLSALINRLNEMGNNRAKLITTVNKGYRLDGTRHPHSWSILDSEECVTWMVGIINGE